MRDQHAPAAEAGESLPERGARTPTASGYLPLIAGSSDKRSSAAPVIRDALSEEDTDAIRELFLEYQAEIGVDLCFQGFREELANLPGDYSRPSGRLLVASDGEKILGGVGLRALCDRDCEMKRLYVRPEARRLRLGRLLVTTVIAEARTAGYRRILLDTLPSMDTAIALYRSLGFTDATPYRHNPVAGALFFALELQPSPLKRKY